MNPLPVRTQRLYARLLQTQDLVVRVKAILPLFDEAGRVGKILVVLDDSARAAALDWRPDLVSVPWIGPIRLDVSCGVLSRVAASTDFSPRLWYFDPMQLLGAPGDRFAGEDAGAMWTNCAGQWRGGVRTLYFARDLSRIRLMTLSKNGSLQISRWNPSYLPATTPPVSAAPRRTARTTWQLRPIWQE